MPTCPVDARPTENVLCPGCVGALSAELRQVPWLVHQLDITLTRQARVGERNGPRSSERPLPFDLNASIDLEAMRDTLQYWVGEVAERRGIVTPFEDAVTLARWMQMWPSELAALPDAGDMLDQILSVTASARRTIDRRPEMKFVGPCDGHGATHWLAKSDPAVDPSSAQYAGSAFKGCGEEMYAHLHARSIMCRTTECGAVYNVEDRRAWLLEAASDQLRTAKQLSDELPWIAGVTITSKLIGMWAARGTTALGKLHVYLPHPRDPRAAQRFRVGEVIDYARAMQLERHQKVSGAA